MRRGNLQLVVVLFIIFNDSVPLCDCGGIVRPDVVLYGEMLPEAYSYASYYILKADVLIGAGTSLTVNPAKGLLNLYQGKHLIIMNEQATPEDEHAELVIHRSLGDIVKDYTALIDGETGDEFYC